MKKKLLAGLFGCMLAFSLVSCGNENATLNVNIENDKELSINTVGIDNLIDIGGMLYYDKTTRIVYFWNGYCSRDWATMPSAYYAPNGLPYKYNPETNTFEEIDSNLNGEEQENE